MRIYRKLPLKDHRPRIISIGCFDGVHRGHQKLLNHLKKISQIEKLTSSIILIANHPNQVTQPDLIPPYLFSLRERILKIEKQGIEEVCLLRFTPAIAAIKAHQFFQYLSEMGTQILVLGKDARIGHKGEGDVNFLQQEGKKYNIHLQVVPDLIEKGEKISSTQIRKLLQDSHFFQAIQYLGEPYTISGNVIYGRQKASQLLNCPTANIPLFGHPPLQGVYAVRVRMNSYTTYNGIANIGVRPSFNLAHSSPLLEVHLLDWKGTLYGRRIYIEFIAKIREEQKFSSIESLRIHIVHDIQKARQILLPY